jgi:hypothetical protein
MSRGMRVPWWASSYKDRTKGGVLIPAHIYIFHNAIKICGGRARPRGPGGSMKYQFVYLNVVCLDGPAGQGKPFRSSLKYLFVYFNVCIFKCSYRILHVLLSSF